MSSNGDHIQNNVGVDQQRGSNTNRFRSNPRRGRGRGSQDRNSSGRVYRDRKSGSWRDPIQKNSNYESQIIDIHDSSQWPSIQEGSTGSVNRARNPPPPPDQINPEPQQYGDEQNQGYDEQSERRRSGYIRNSNYSSQSGVGPQQGSYNSYQPREFGYRPFQSNRSRGVRYNTPNPRYSGGNYGRRYSRGSYQPMGVAYPPDSVFTGYYNGHFMVTGYPMPCPPEPKPKDIDPIKQVEYYFSSANLTTDRYLRSQMDKEGWVDLNVVFKFKRIQTLEITFDDFFNLLLTSELLDIDSEKKRVRPKSEPEKWWLDPSVKSPSISAESTSPPMSQYSGSQFPSGNEPFNYNQGYSGVGQSNPCVPFPPMFFSFPGYSNNSGRGRYPSSYNVNPGSYYGVPYSDMAQEMGSYQYYMPADYSGYYPSDAVPSGYYSTSNTNEEFGNVTESVPPEQYASYSQSDYQADKAQELLGLQQRQSEGVEELSKNLADLNVAKEETD